MAGPNELGALLETHRRPPVAVLAPIGLVAVFSVGTYVLTHSVVWVVVIALASLFPILVLARTRLSVFEHGIEIHGVASRRQLRWSEVERFERSTVLGRPGTTGSAVVNGSSVEITAVAQNLDETIGHLNELLARFNPRA